MRDHIYGVAPLVGDVDSQVKCLISLWRVCQTAGSVREVSLDAVAEYTFAAPVKACWNRHGFPYHEAAVLRAGQGLLVRHSLRGFVGEVVQDIGVCSKACSIRECCHHLFQAGHSSCISCDMYLKIIYCHVLASLLVTLHLGLANQLHSIAVQRERRAYLAHAWLHWRQRRCPEPA